MIIPIEEYIKKYNSSADYIKSLAKPQLRCDHIPNQFLPQETGMFKWYDNDAHIWAGPFEGNFVFYKITDYNHSYPSLNSINEIKEHERTYKKYNAYSWPPIYPKKILGDNWNICYVGETKCARSELTNIELETLIKNSTPFEIDFYNKKISNAENNLYFHLETPSKEFPVELYMCGNDDCSYSKLFIDMNSAKEYLTKLEENNNYNIIKTDFVFTN